MTPTALRYYVLYKPYDVLSQFTKEIPEHKTLKDCYDFPSGVYPLGRLDRDSEGLLVLTNDNYVKHRILDPNFQHKRTYWAQVERIPSEDALEQLRQGVTIRIKKKSYNTLVAQVSLLRDSPNLPERNPPIRFRKDIPTAWLQLSLTEGKNRQIRRMCAAVGHPVLRLVRASIEQLELGNLQPGEVREYKRGRVYELLLIT